MKCNILLDKHTKYLHTHHTKGPQYNEPEYLKALCIGCHAEESGKGHSDLKKTDTYQDFMTDYEEQWQRQIELTRKRLQSD